MGLSHFCSGALNIGFSLCVCKSGLTSLISHGSDGDGNGSLTPLKLSSELRVSMFLSPPWDSKCREGAGGHTHTPGSGRAAWAESLGKHTAALAGCSNSHQVFPTFKGPFSVGMLPSCHIVVRATQRIPTQKYERALGVIGTDITFVCGGDKFKGIIILQVIFCEWLNVAVALGLNELNASGTYCMLEGSFAAKTALYKCVCTEKKN